MAPKSSIVDLSKLDTETRKKVERAISPHNKMCTYKFSPADIECWEAMAARNKTELTEWMCDGLNWAIKHPARDVRSVSDKEAARASRTYPLSRRFNDVEHAAWVEAANDEPITVWIERSLNRYAKAGR
jgi:hypothetical protein